MKEVAFVATKPSLILNESVGGVKVVTSLYGEVTPERTAQAHADAKYRAEQLSPAPARPRREFIPREARENLFDGYDDDDDEDDRRKKVRRKR